MICELLKKVQLTRELTTFKILEMNDPTSNNTLSIKIIMWCHISRSENTLNLFQGYLDCLSNTPFGSTELEKVNTQLDGADSVRYQRSTVKVFNFNFGLLPSIIQ